ncbi:Crp/Fnr family transcriptional regulator [Caenispirillum salinarum]|uniref:Crp/Fnr family transcriptional regulator n=1 Tax=Caenispirillum salinarum TaxID=859058 RepID=UPI00384E3B97
MNQIGHLAGATMQCAGQSSSEAGRRAQRCRSCTVRKNALFVGLSPTELDEIAPAVPDIVVPAGETLYDAESRADSLFIIRRGVVKLVNYLPDGSYRIVRLARRTDVLALETLLGEPCDHTAEALTEVEVCRVPIGVVRMVMERQAWLSTRMIHHWHLAVQTAHGWLTRYATGGARQRMARFLADLHDECVSEACPRPCFEVPSRDDVGAILGITKETASRLISDFRRSGLLCKVDARRIEVDRERLEEVAAAEA